jgi:5-hydroxyisourate hydrolase-like protein (transthyretin family)
MKNVKRLVKKWVFTHISYLYTARYQLIISLFSLLCWSKAIAAIPTVTIFLVDGVSGQPWSNVVVLAYEQRQQPRSVTTLVATATTNTQGRVSFRLDHLGQADIQYVFEFATSDSARQERFCQRNYCTPPITTASSPLDVVLYPENYGFLINRIQLLNRITFGATPALLEHVKTVGAYAFIAEQLNPAAIDDSELESRLSNLVVEKDYDLSLWLLLHAIYSQRQLQEVMTQFWDNHFSTDIFTSGGVKIEQTENQRFRQQALGQFRDLLQISATSPAMLRYLNNNTNRKEAPNENYARELMELHTLGVNGGYTEQDVAEVARVFTGWSLSGNQFQFRPQWHDTGEKVVLGHVIPAGGDMAEGEQVLDLLAAHPATARFICTKLLQLLVSDQPTDTAINDCAAVFLATAGDISQVVTAILLSPEFNNPLQFHSKVKTPLEFIAGVVRNLAGITPDTDRNLYRATIAMGMPLFGNPVPTGWSELGENWVTSDQLMQHVQFINQTLFQNNQTLVHVDLINLFLDQGYETAEAVVNFLLELTLANDYSPTIQTIAVEILNTGTPFDIHAADATEKLRRLVSTILSFPSYQLQ